MKKLRWYGQIVMLNGSKQENNKNTNFACTFTRLFTYAIIHVFIHIHIKIDPSILPVGDKTLFLEELWAPTSQERDIFRSF